MTAGLPRQTRPSLRRWTSQPWSRCRSRRAAARVTDRLGIALRRSGTFRRKAFGGPYCSQYLMKPSRSTHFVPVPRHASSRYLIRESIGSVSQIRRKTAASRSLPDRLLLTMPRFVGRRPLSSSHAVSRALGETLSASRGVHPRHRGAHCRAKKNHRGDGERESRYQTRRGRAAPAKTQPGAACSR